jgi:hypothetical protein
MSGMRVAKQARNTVCMSENPAPQTKLRLFSCVRVNSTILAMKEDRNTVCMLENSASQTKL